MLTQVMAHLMEHEKEALLSALRRDYRHETDFVRTDTQWADWHRANARNDINLLQQLNPKKPTKAPITEERTAEVVSITEVDVCKMKVKLIEAA